MAIAVDEALNYILDVSLKKDTEFIKIEDASNRISVNTIRVKYPLPRFDNSAMDGYAICYEDIGKEVEIVGKIFAGDNQKLSLTNGTAIKIMTGAKIPENTTAIIPQEDILSFNDDKILLPKNVKEYQHIRRIGEDIDIDDIIIDKNEEINFAIISLLASQGVTTIEVYKKPKVAVFASGEELRPHYETIEPHQIYNSNSPSFISRVKELGCDVEFIGSAHDTLESLQEHIKKSLDYDLIVTSGGVSVGEADFTKEAFSSFDMDIIFNGIMIKPGKPTVFGKINNTFVLNLPGNPFASQIIFEMFGTILIQKLRMSNLIYHNYISTFNKETIKNKSGRVTLLPGNFDGESFIVSNKKGPGMVSVLKYSNSFIVLDKNVEQININDKVKVISINNKQFTNIKKDLYTYDDK